MRLKFFSTFFLVFFTIALYAQYTQSSITYVAPSRQANNVSTSNCDDCNYNINIGFTFSFFGTAYTAVNVGTNGLMRFGSSGNEYNACIPSTAAPNNFIAGYWDDGYFTYSGCSAGYWTYGTTGTAPNRVFTCYWEGYGVYAGSQCNDFGMAIRLYETTNVIEVHLVKAYNNSSATIGIENSTGTIGYQAACNQGLSNAVAWRWTPCTNPGAVTLSVSSGNGTAVYAGTPVTYTATGGSGGTFSTLQYQYDGTGGTWTNWSVGNGGSWTPAQNSTDVGHTLYVRAIYVNGACTTVSNIVSTPVISNTVGFSESSGSSNVAPGSTTTCAGTEWSSNFCAGSGTQTTLGTLIANVNYTVENQATNACGTTMSTAFLQGFSGGTAGNCNWTKIGNPAVNSVSFTMPSTTTASVNVSTNLNTVSGQTTGVFSGNTCTGGYGHDFTGNSAVLRYRQNTTIANSTSTTNMCVGVGRTCTATLGGTYGTTNGPTITWSVDEGAGRGTFGTATQTNGVSTVTFTPASAGTATLRATIGAYSCAVAVTVTAVPTANAGSDATICSGSAYTLAGSSIGGSASNGTWSIVSVTGSMTNAATQLSNTAATTTPATVTFTPIAGNTGTVTLRLTTNDPAGDCAAATDDVVLTVTAPATANAGADGTACTGSAYTLTGSSIGGGASTGTWSILSVTGTMTNATSQLSSTAATATPATVTFTPIAGNTGTVTLRLTTNDPAGTCPAVSDDMVLTVNATATANAGADATICSGSAYTLTGSSIGGAASNGTWSIVSVTGSMTNAASQLSSTASTATPATITFTPIAGNTGTVTLRLTTNDPAGPCAAAQDDVVLTVTAPATVNAGSDATICSGSAYTLAGATFGGGATNVTWSILSVTGSMTNAATQLSSTASTTTPATITFTPVAGNSGTVTLRLTTNDPAGTCPAVTDDVVLTVTLPAIAAAGSDATICSGAAYTLAGSSISGGASNGTWSIVSVTGSMTNATSQLSSTASTATPSSVTFTPIAGNTGTVTLRLTTNDPAGTCPSVFDDVILTVTAPATVNAGSDATICSGSAYTLAGATFGGGASNVTWSILSVTGTMTNAASQLSNTASTTTPATVTFTPIAGNTGTVTLRLTTNDPAGTCAAVTDDVVLTVTTVATANAGADATICSGSAYTLTGSAIGGGASTGTWSILSVTGTMTSASSQLSNTGATATPASVTFTPIISNSGTVTLRLTTDDPAGTCPAVNDDVVLTVNPVATVNAGTDANICAGAAHTLAGATIGGAATSGTWSIVSVTGSMTTASSQLSNTAATATPATVTFTPIAGNSGTVTLRLSTNDPAGPCNLVTDDVVLTIGAVPTVNAGTDATICSGAAYTLAGSAIGGGASTGTWSIVSVTGSMTSASSQLSNTAATATPASVTFTPIAGNTGTVTLRLTTNDPAGPCNAVTDDVVLTVGAAAVANAGADATICSGAAYTLSGSSLSGGATNGTWSIVSVTGSMTTASSQLSSTAPTSTPSTVTFTPIAGNTGSVTLRLTSDDPAGSCPAVQDDVVLTITTPATVNAGSDATICSGSAYTLTGAIFGGGATNATWSIVSVTGTMTTAASQLSNTAATTTPATVTFTPIAGNSGTVTLRLTTNDPAGTCTAVQDDVVLTVTSAAVSNAGFDATICSGNAYTLTGSSISGGATTGTWSIVSVTGSMTNATSQLSSISATATPAAVTFTPIAGNSGTVTLRLTTDDPAGTCTAVSDDVVLTVSPQPTVNAGADAPICSGNAYTLAGATFGGSASNVIWTIQSVTGTMTNASSQLSQTSTTTTPATVTFTPVAGNTGTVTLRLTTNDPIGTCTSVFDEVVLTVNPSPTATAANNGPVCSGQTLTLTGGGNGYTSYAWSGPLSYSNSTQSPTVSTNATAGMGGVYTITVTNSDNCSATASTTVSVSTTPSFGVTGTNPSTCSGTNGSITLSGFAASTSGYTLNYLKGGVPVGPLSVSSNASGEIVITNLTAAAYTDIIITFNSCSSAPGSVTLTDPAPPTVVVTDPAPVCSPATVDITVPAITAGSTSGLTYTYWTNGGATNTYGTPTTATAGTYYIKGTVPATGCYQTQPVNVVINPSPTVVITNPSPVCSPATVDITAPAITTGSTSGLTFTYWTNAGATTSYSTPATAGAGTYYIKGTNSNGCYDIQPVVVTLTTPPAIPVASVTSQPTCAVPSGTITVSSPIGAQYEYQLDAGSFQTSTVFSGVSSGTHTVKARLIASPSCVSAASGTITVNAAPTPLVTNPVTICQGGSGELTVDPGSVCVQNFVVPTIPGPNQIYGGWLAGDPTASTLSGAVNTSTCSFTGANRTYSVVQFQVSTTGDYIFEMNTNTAYNGAGYIVTGNFTPGSCSGGQLIRADNNSGTGGEPKLGSVGNPLTLTAGITYSLVSTTDGATDVVNNDYNWTITPPAGGNVLINQPGTVEWYTASSGGSPIGSGTSFNPVGVPGSGLTNTNTQGTYSFWAACTSSPSCRTQADFIISSNVTIHNVTPTGESCYNPLVPVTVGLSNSTAGLNYQLRRDGVAVGSPVTSSGGAITIGNTGVAGTYTVTVNSGSCNVPMNGTVEIKPLPLADAGSDVTLNCGSNLTLNATSNNTTLFTEDFGAGVSSELSSTTSAWRIKYLYGTEPHNRSEWWITYNGATPLANMENPVNNITAGSGLTMFDHRIYETVMPGDYAWDAGTLDEIAYNVTPIDARLYTSVNLSFNYQVGGTYSGTDVYDYLQVMYSLDNGATWVPVSAGNNVGTFNLYRGMGSTNAFFANSPITGTANVTMPAAVVGKKFLLGFRWVNDGDLTGAYVGGPMVDNINITGAASYSWTPTAGVTGSGTASPTITQGGTYTVVVTAGNGCTASDQVVVTAASIPNISVSGNQDVCSGGSVTLTASVTGGTGTVTNILWERSANNGGSWSTVQSSTSSTYNTSTSLGVGNYLYKATVTMSTNCSNTSSNVSVDVKADPAVTLEPVDVYLCSGGSATLTVAASGGAPNLLYEWEYDNGTIVSNSNPTGVTYSGETTTDLIITTAGNTPPVTVPLWAKVYATGPGCDDAYSLFANVIILADPTVSNPTPATQTGLCSGGTASPISVTANGGTGAYSYQWYSNTTNSTSGGSIINGANGTSYTPPVVSGTTYYYCVVGQAGSGCGPVTTAATASVTAGTPVVANVVVDECMNFAVGDKYYVLVTGSGGTPPYTYPGAFYTSTTNQGIHELNAGASGTYTVTDAAGCSTTSSAVTAPTGRPNDIVMTSATGNITVDCWVNNYNKWVTFRDAVTNNAIMAINDNQSNLGLVTVDVYKDAAPPVIYNNPLATNCTWTQHTAMRRHFKLSSTLAPTTGVDVMLFFSDDDYNALKADAWNNNTGYPNPNYACTELDDVYNFNDIYVTKYTGNNEDGNYLNNSPSGLYRVYGDNTTPNRPLIKGEYTGSNTGFQGIYGGAQTHHYVQMTVTEFSEFWLHGSQQSQPLPVEMIYLQADAMNNAYIRLSWATAVEVNNRGFEVERSTDGQNWTQIGFVDGHNNATVQHNYYYDDMAVAAGVVYYYRLKQVDYDNAFEYTDIVSARIAGEATFSVKEFIPNPTTDRTSLIVTGTKEQEISIAFYNIVGQKVLESNHVVNKGANTIGFDLARLASGTYTAVVSSANEVYTQKIVLTR